MVNVCTILQNRCNEGACCVQTCLSCSDGYLQHNHCHTTYLYGYDMKLWQRAVI